jgi:hypothetical protein
MKANMTLITSTLNNIGPGSYCDPKIMEGNSADHAKNCFTRARNQKEENL